MKKYRVGLLTGIAGAGLLPPWSEFGALCIQLFTPALLGGGVAWLFTDWSRRARVALLGGLVFGVALGRICWEAIVWDGGDWSFDGEQSLVALSVAMQFFFAVAAFIGTRFFTARTPFQLNR